MPAESTMEGREEEEEEEALSGSRDLREDKPAAFDVRADWLPHPRFHVFSTRLEEAAASGSIPAKTLDHNRKQVRFFLVRVKCRDS